MCFLHLTRDEAKLVMAALKQYRKGLAKDDPVKGEITVIEMHLWKKLRY